MSKKFAEKKKVRIFAARLRNNGNKTAFRSCDAEVLKQIVFGLFQPSARRASADRRSNLSVVRKEERATTRQSAERNKKVQ